jgi:hypothetical protein
MLRSAGACAEALCSRLCYLPLSSWQQNKLERYQCVII